MFIILFFEIILNIKFISNNFVVFHFNELFDDYNKLDKKESICKIFLDNYLDYKIYTEIKIGSPTKIIPLFINSNIKIFRTKFDGIITNFNFNKYEEYQPYNSQSFINITELLNLEEFYFFGYSLINETIFLCKDKNCEKEYEVKNFQLYAQTKKDKLNYSYSLGEFGIPLSKSANEQTNILIELKNLEIINTTIFTIEYTDNNEGYIYLGEYPHIYNNIEYNKDLLMTAYSIPNYGSNNQINLKMDTIYIINGTDCSCVILNNKGISFNYGSGIILSTEEYFNKILEIFFNKYINQNICKINIERRNINNNYHIISCKNSEEFKIEEFPTFYLFKEEFNFIFELDYKDLFEQIDNSFIFLIIYFPFSCDNFEFGKPFLKKYQLSYNVDMSTVHFYKKNNTNNNVIIKNTNKHIFFIFILIILVAFFIGVYYKNFFHTKRKKRKNELNENFDFDIPINDIN